MVARKRILLDSPESLKRLRDMISADAQCSKIFASKIISQHGIENFAVLSSRAKERYKDERINKRRKRGKSNEEEKHFTFKF